MKNATITKTHALGCKAAYNLQYNGTKHLLNIYHDGHGYFVDCIAENGKPLSRRKQLFFEEGDSVISNTATVAEMVDLIFSIATKGTLHIA